MDNKEPENPVVYLSNLVKKLDVKNRNGLVALAIVNLLVIYRINPLKINFNNELIKTSHILNTNRLCS